MRRAASFESRHQESLFRRLSWCLCVFVVNNDAGLLGAAVSLCCRREDGHAQITRDSVLHYLRDHQLHRPAFAGRVKDHGLLNSLAANRHHSRLCAEMECSVYFLLSQIRASDPQVNAWSDLLTAPIRNVKVDSLPVALIDKSIDDNLV